MVDRKLKWRKVNCPQLCLHLRWWRMKKMCTVIVTSCLVRMLSCREMTRWKSELIWLRQEKNDEFNYAVVENEVEDGEGSAPKSVDDSENASDGSEDIS